MGLGWGLLDQVVEDERNYEKALMAWVQQAYEGQCDMQANPHLFSLPWRRLRPGQADRYRGRFLQRVPRAGIREV